MYVRYVITPFLLTLLSGCGVAQAFNAGIVQGLWYAQEDVFAEEPTRIYVAIRNNTGADLTGTVTFRVDDTLIARKDVSALDGRIIESWTDWTPTYGEHTITASLSRVELHRVGTDVQRLPATSAVAKDTIFVDLDTDGDGVGNDTDADDDGDGLSDETERENGTDPLTFTEAEPNPETDVLGESTSTATASEATGEPSVHTATEGLERYLAPSPARSTLANLTELVERSKRRLDEYRHARAETSAQNDTDTVVDENGFGEIARATDTEAETTSQRPAAGLWGTIVATIGTLLSAVYAGVLAALSVFLGHPMVVQLALLFAILFGVYKLARRWGNRGG